MFIQRETAKKIIREISTVLDYDINIMNKEGIILASTNPDRVDCFHEAAYKIIHEQLSELMVYYDGEYQGCRKGINLPILMKDTIIGVIGMTGDLEEITKYGRILKKMTEIMVLDMFNLHQKSMEEQRKMFLIREIIAGDHQPEETKAALRRYGLDRKDRYTAILYKPASLLERHSVKETLAVSLGDTGAAISQLSPEKLRERLTAILAAEETARIFVGSVRNTHQEIGKSFEDAEKVSRYYDDHPEKPLLLYEDHLIDIILNNVHKDEREACVSKTFQGCGRDEIKDYIAFIDAYSKNNGSINKLAELFYVHKNTVQYKINKIQTKTGLNMRSTEDLFQLKLAAKWFTED